MSDVPAAWSSPDLQGVLLLAALVAIAAGGWALLHFRSKTRKLAEEHLRVMRDLTRDRDELQAAIGSMADAVIAVDMDGRLISLNTPASELLSISPEQALGLPLDRATTFEPLNNLVQESLDSSRAIVVDMEIGTDGADDPRLCEPRLFQAVASVLKHRDAHRIGSLIVMHDVTRLRRLEVVRRDFVANASHEIRTPVAAIRMAAETLDTDSPPPDPAITSRFLQIIVRQSDRLQALIDDLLSLTRIEQDSENRRVTLENKPVIAVLRSAVETCQTAADPRKTRVVMDCPFELSAPINAPLLEQAVVNLLDNAIKYSPDGSLVRCTAEREGREVILSVYDRGSGIAPEHLPRIFERFYRTDRARSREVGGTGLGLSIVKHIALAHHGRVSVDSTPGKGSVFRLHIPATT